MATRKNTQRKAQAHDSAAIADDPTVKEIGELMADNPQPAEPAPVPVDGKEPEVFNPVNLNKIRLVFDVDVSDSTDKDTAPVWEHRDYGVTDLIKNAVGIEKDINRVNNEVREISAMVMSLAKQFPTVGSFGAVCSQIEEQAKWGRVPAGTLKSVAAQYRPLPQTYKNAKSICKQALENNIVPFVKKRVPCKPSDPKAKVIDHTESPLNTFNQVKEAVNWTKKAIDLSKQSEATQEKQAEANRNSSDNPHTKSMYVHDDLVTAVAKYSKTYEKADTEKQLDMMAALDDLLKEYCN
jgi:hypothetical protein